MANQLIDKALAYVGKNIQQPIKFVRYGWQVSGTFAERSRLLANASPSNAVNPSDKPSGYSFFCWGQIISDGWVGAIYPANPTNETTDLWTPTGKTQTTTGRSIVGIAIYIRNDLA